MPMKPSALVSPLGWSELKTLQEIDSDAYLDNLRGSIGTQPISPFLSRP